MAAEGMVDALRRAHGMVKPAGFVVDLHPSAVAAAIEVGDVHTGRVEDEDGPLRHGSAGLALAAAINGRLFTVERRLTFTFYTYGDSIEELCDYVAEHWGDGRIGEETVGRTRDAARSASDSRPRIREVIYVTKLRPVAVKGFAER
jgi:hypothetical protein